MFRPDIYDKYYDAYDDEYDNEYDDEYLRGRKEDEDYEKYICIHYDEIKKEKENKE